jgi:signal transduction histidine kinase
MPDAIDDDSWQQLVAKIVDVRRAEILRSYEDRLRASDWAGPREVPDRLMEQAAAVLDDIRRRVADGTAAQLAGHAGPPSPDGAAPDLAAAELLRAAGVLLRTVIETVAAELPPRPEAARTLSNLACVAHEAIVHRLTVVAGGYAGYLLDRLHRSHVDERRRVARELHDIIAHSVAVALQDLEMFAVRREVDAVRAEAKLDAAMVNLRDTLDMLRTIAQDLRRSAAESGLTAALRSYLESAPVDQETELHVVGDETRLSPSVRGELFLVLREALRNAHVHAAASAVRARIEIDTDAVRAVVIDDGRGFDPVAAPAERGAGTGLASMRERVALLGGVIELRSMPGEGTSVSVRVPLMRTWDDGED